MEEGLKGCSLPVKVFPSGPEVLAWSEGPLLRGWPRMMHAPAHRDTWGLLAQVSSQIVLMLSRLVHGL